MPEENQKKLKQKIEALLFAHDEPISLKELKNITGEKEEVLKNIINELRSEYEISERAYEILEIANGYQIFVKRDFYDLINNFRKGKEETKLSPAALETLAIIAYKQPISKSVIESIRGVQSDYIIRGLLDKALIKIAGREDTPGKPILYATTDRFLQLLGINSLQDLPKPEELTKTQQV